MKIELWSHNGPVRVRTGQVPHASYLITGQSPAPLKAVVSRAQTAPDRPPRQIYGLLLAAE